MSKWIKKWKAPSNSTPGKEYTVSIDREGNYGCSCPRWKFQRAPFDERESCDHIEDVIAGRISPEGETLKAEPRIVLASVRAVIPVIGEDGETVEEVLTPLYPVDDGWFQATIVYDLLRAGVKWATLRKRYAIARVNSKKNIIANIEGRGRRIYGPLENPPRKQTYEIVPVITTHRQ